MARLVSAEQLLALQSLDRTTRTRVKIEDPDGTMQDVTNLNGKDFLNECVIEHSTDYPVSNATISLWRRVDDQSLAPLIEESRANRDQYDNYAPFLNPHRQVTVEVATLHAMHPVTSSDWIELWKGTIDEVQWGGFPSKVVVRCRDILADLNDTIIETEGTYGHDGTLPNIATVSQEILDDNETSMTLAVPEAITFGIYEYDLARVSVLDALKALADLPGANLHMRWSDIAAEHQLTLWMPDREATSADWTIGPDDYYDVSRLNLSIAGIRNVVDVVYTDANGTEQTEQAFDGSSIAFYGRRYMRIDARGTSLTTSGQASSLAVSLVSDLALPPAVQEIESAFWWPLELGDMVTYTANGEHYDTDQTWATFAYRHVLTSDRCRTFISARGQPSGGYARWHGREQLGSTSLVPTTAGLFFIDTTARTVTGAVTESVLTVPLQGGAISETSDVKIRISAVPTGAAAGKQLIINLNQQNIGVLAWASGFNGRGTADIVVSWGGSTSAQRTSFTSTYDGLAGIAALWETGADTSGPVTIELIAGPGFTGQTVTVDYVRVELAGAV